MKLKIKNKNNTQEEEKTERKQKGFRLKSETLIMNYLFFILNILEYKNIFYIAFAVIWMVGIP